MKNCLVIIYHSFSDPIFKGLMLRYIQRFQESVHSKKYAFHIITFEHSDYCLSGDEVLNIKQELETLNIFWYPLNYHSGGMLFLFKKLYELINVILKAFWLNIKYRFQYVIGFTTVSGALAMYISKFLRTPLILMNIEPHSDYMADFGIWRRNGIKYRVLSYLESKMISSSNHVALPTRNAFNEWKKKQINGKLHFLPTCIDLDDFKFDEMGRKNYRAMLDVSDTTKVIVYLGKFGGIYYSIEETAAIFSSIKSMVGDVLFYVITTEQLSNVDRVFKAEGLEGYYFLKNRIPLEELAEHLSAADFGILLVPPYPSQKYRCPIKTANYLACGLPFIITENIGDDSDLAIEERVGIVLGHNEGEIFANHWNDKTYLRSIAEKHRGVDLVTSFLSEVLD